MAYRLMVHGKFACFARPGPMVDLVTYDVITPLAARRLFEAIHWSPEIWWVVERIDVLEPIHTKWQSFDKCGDDNGGRRILCLADVRYVVYAHFDTVDGGGTGAHAAMFKRRARNGQYYRAPHLGHADWPATVRLLGEDEQPVSMLAKGPAVDLGWMVFDRDREDRSCLRYFRPIMTGGVIDLTGVNASELPR